jgi:hypothetical protein
VGEINVSYGRVARTISPRDVGSKARTVHTGRGERERKRQWGGGGESGGSDEEMTV